MSTVIAVYNSEGCVGRCDAKCHEATCADCDCICGGRFHGIGSSEQAIVQNTEDHKEALRAFAERNGYDADELELRFMQGALL
jgi:hypothetical protein